ncbi:MAG: hypothetical protein ACPH14_09310 [Candidatus Puniceispirillaceae bacterium]
MSMPAGEKQVNNLASQRRWFCDFGGNPGRNRPERQALEPKKKGRIDATGTESPRDFMSDSVFVV